VALDSAFYLVRPADQQFRAAIDRRDSIVLVKGARQMGKTSLLARGLQRAREAGARVVRTDFQKLNQQHLESADALFLKLADTIADQLDLETLPDQTWHARRGPSENFERYWQRVALRQVEAPIVWGLDEVDRLFTAEYASEVFGLFRSWHNERALDPDGLAASVERSAVSVEGRSDLSAGARSAGDRPALNAHLLLRRILHWTGGHPYLTQRLCAALAAPSTSSTPTHLAHASRGYPTQTPIQSVDRSVHDLFLSPAAQEQDDNLILVRERLLRSEADLAGLLELYRQVRAGQRVKADDTNQLVGILRLSGITRLVDGRLEVRNLIYERVFDREWVITHMPDAELRRQRCAFRRGLLRASGVAAVIVAALAILSGMAVQNAALAQDRSQEAAKNQRVADIRSQKAQQLAAQLQEALGKEKQARQELERALGRVRHEKQRADGKATRANGQARLANAARGRAVRAQAAALTAAHDADRQKGIVQAKSQESLGRLVRLNDYTGEQLLDAGDPLGALPWFAESFRLQRGDRARSRSTASPGKPHAAVLARGANRPAGGADRGAFQGQARRPDAPGAGRRGGDGLGSRPGPGNAGQRADEARRPGDLCRLQRRRTARGHHLREPERTADGPRLGRADGRSGEPAAPDRSR
jgi:hypothetical protein